MSTGLRSKLSGRSGQGHCVYAYDATNRLVRVDLSIQSRWRIWRGDGVVNEVRQEDGRQTSVTWLGGAQGAFAELIDGRDARRSLLATSLSGSVLQEVDDTVRPFCHAPHGHCTGRQNESAPAVEVAYNGELLDAASGCYLLGAGHHRPYSPTFGLFLASDRASPFSRGGLNGLSYCAGDPINRTDPSGHFWKWIVAGVTLALSAVAVGLSAGAALPALVGAAAMTKTAMAATASMTLGVVGMAAETGALLTRDQTVANVLGYVGMGIAAIGAAGAIKGAIKAATKGATKAATKAATTLSSKQAKFAGQVTKVKSSSLSDIVGLPSHRQRVMVKPLHEVAGPSSNARLYTSDAAQAQARLRGYPLRSELSDAGYDIALARAHEKIRFKGPSIESFSFREDGLYDQVSGSIHRWDPVPTPASQSAEVPWNLAPYERSVPQGLPSYWRSQRGFHPDLPSYSWNVRPGEQRLYYQPQMTDL